MKKFTTTEI